MTTLLRPDADRAWGRDPDALVTRIARKIVRQRRRRGGHSDAVADSYKSAADHYETVAEILEAAAREERSVTPVATDGDRRRHESQDGYRRRPFTWIAKYSFF